MCPNNNFLKPKMVLDFVFDGFLCISMVCLNFNSIGHSYQNQFQQTRNPSFRILKLWDPFLAKNGPFCSIFTKIRKMYHIFGFYMIQTKEIHEKPSKTKSKTIFGSRKSLFGPFTLYHFYIGKVRFLPYLAVLKR